MLVAVRRSLSTSCDRAVSAYSNKSSVFRTGCLVSLNTLPVRFPVTWRGVSRPSLDAQPSGDAAQPQVEQRAHRLGDSTTSANATAHTRRRRVHAWCAVHALHIPRVEC